MREVSREKIIETGYRVLRGKLPIETRPWYCLKLIRQIIEETLDIEPGGFYRFAVLPNFKRYPDEDEKSIKPYWARGAERALRAAGLARKDTSRTEPGDLLFSYRVSKPYGHVGLLMDGKMVLENTTVDRGWRKSGMKAVRFTPLREFSPITTVIDADKLIQIIEQAREVQ